MIAVFFQHYHILYPFLETDRIHFELIMLNCIRIRDDETVIVNNILIIANNDQLRNESYFERRLLNDVEL